MRREKEGEGGRHAWKGECTRHVHVRYAGPREVTLLIR
jgi:hypothetical protein